MIFFSNLTTIKKYNPCSIYPPRVAQYPRRAILIVIIDNVSEKLDICLRWYDVRV